MKQLIVWVFFMFMCPVLYAQISVTKTKVICKTNFGAQNLVYAEKDSVGVFALSLKSNNEFHGRIVAILGDKQQALTTLQSMYDYENEDGDVIELNNPTNNSAVYKKILGVWMYVIYAEHSNRIYGYLAKKQIKKMITALEKE